MSRSQKININNLLIVWQGQSWSVIAPSGEVLGRFQNQRDAVSFAYNHEEYLGDSSKSYFSNSSFADEKPKNEYLSFSGRASQPQMERGNSEKREDTCFELFIGLLILVIIGIPIPTLLCLAISTVFFGLRLPNVQGGIETTVALLQHPATIPIQIILLVIIPGSLMLLGRRKNRTTRRLFRQPLTMLAGLLGVLGGLLGCVITLLNVFSGIDLMRIIISTILWCLMCFFVFQVADDL